MVCLKSLMPQYNLFSLSFNLFVSLSFKLLFLCQSEFNNHRWKNSKLYFCPSDVFSAGELFMVIKTRQKSNHQNIVKIIYLNRSFIKSDKITCKWKRFRFGQEMGESCYQSH